MGAYADLLPDSSDSANTSSSVARSSGNQRVDAFVEQYRPIAERVAEQTGNDAELYLAKWGLETGWGKSIIPGTNNLGNIKDFSGSGVSAKDNATGSVDRYRQYKDANQFADDYASILKRRYKNALNVGSDMDTFATELKRAGYAEDPNYVSKLKSAYNMLGASAAQSDASQPSPNARGEYEPRTDYSAALRQFDKVPNDTYEANRLASTPKGMSISKEISAAIDSYQANLWSIPAAMGSEYALNAMLENKSAAEQQWADSGAPQSFSEMEFGKNFGQYFAHMAIQSAPYMLEFIASGFGVGSLAKGALANTAKGVAEKAAIEAAKQGATKEAAKKAGEVAAKEFMGTVYTASGVAGSYPSAVGDVLSNQYEQSGKFNLPAAAALGVPYAALNAAGAEGMLTRGLARGLPKTSLTAKGAAGFAGRAALTGAEAGLMEGSTETGQEVMNQLGRMAVDPDAKIDDKRALEAYKESFIAGGLLGGVPGAVAGGFRKPEDANLQPPAPVANSPLSSAVNTAQHVEKQRQQAAVDDNLEQILGMIAQRDDLTERIAGLQNMIDRADPSSEDGQRIRAMQSDMQMRRDSLVAQLDAAKAFYGGDQTANVGPTNDPLILGNEQMSRIYQVTQNLLNDPASLDPESRSGLLKGFSVMRNRTLPEATRIDAAISLIATMDDMAARRAAAASGRADEREWNAFASDEAARDGEASRVAPNQQQGVVTQSAPALATDDRARKAAAAEYEAAYQDLVKAEQLGASDQELMQRQIAMRNAEARLQEINDAIESNRAKETAEKRGALLDRVLASNPGNPNRAFDRALRLEGFRDSTFTEEEKSKIARFNELRNIQEDGISSAPNEAGYFGIREKRASAPAGRYQHLADMLSSGWQLANRHQLTGPNGEVYNLKGAGEAQFVRNKLNQKAGNGNQSPRGGAQGGTDQGDFGVGGAGANGPLPQGGGNGSGQANAIPDTDAPAGAVSEAEATGAGNQPNNSLARSRLTALEDQRIAKYADELRSMAPDSGWAEEGGRLLIAPDGTKSRTKWIPRAEWFIAGMLNSPQESVAAVEKAISGQPMRKAEKLHVQGMMDFLDMQYGIDGESHAEQLATLSDIAYEGESADAQNIIDTLGDVDLESNGAWADEVESMRALGFTEEEINEITRRKQGAFGAIGEEAAGVPAGEAQGAIPEGDGNGNGQAEGQEGFSLNQQTNEEAAAQFAQQQAGESSDITKEQADKERDAVPFSMQMQSQPKPQGTQVGLFTADGRPSVAAKQPESVKRKIFRDNKETGIREVHEVDAQDVAISGLPDHQFFVFKDEEKGAYSLTEASTGLRVGIGETAEAAIANFKAALEKVGVETFAQRVADSQKIPGADGANPTGTQPVADSAPSPVNTSMRDTGAKAFADGLPRVTPEGIKGADKVRWLTGYDDAAKSYGKSQPAASDVFEKMAARMEVEQIEGSDEYVVFERGERGNQNFARFTLGKGGNPVRIKHFFESASTRTPVDMAIKKWAESQQKTDAPVEAAQEQAPAVTPENTTINSGTVAKTDLVKPQASYEHEGVQGASFGRMTHSEAEALHAKYIEAAKDSRQRAKEAKTDFLRKLEKSSEMSAISNAKQLRNIINRLSETYSDYASSQQQETSAEQALPNKSEKSGVSAEQTAAVDGAKEAKTGDQTYSDIEAKLINGEINVEEFMSATGLTDEDVGFLSSNDLREKADVAAKESSPYISGIRKLSEAIYNEMNGLTRGSTAPSRRAYDANVAKYKAAQDTLNVIAKNFEHPFRNNLVAKLPPFLESRYGKQWDSIEYGDKAKKAYYTDSYRKWVDLLIEAARSKQETPADSPKIQSYTKQDTAKPKVFYRDDNGVLWGIPYEMREGQQPKDIKPEFRGEWQRLSGAHWSGNTSLANVEAAAEAEQLSDGEWSDAPISKQRAENPGVKSESEENKEQKPAYADDAELQDALSHLGDVLGDVFGAKLNITGKQYGASDLLPAMSKVIELLIKKGFKSFRESVGAATNAMRGNANTKGFVDQITPRQWKAAYNSVAEFHEGTESEEDVAKYSAEQIQKIIALPEKIKEAEQATNHDATPGQKEAGNYAKGKFAWHGLNIAVETAKGEDRTDKETNGEKWRVTMPATYGYVLGTVGADKDHVDVFMGDKPESQRVYVVNQTKPGSTEFDEHKIMLGYESEGAAIGDYLLSFSDTFGASVLGSVSGPYTIEQFKEMLAADRFKKAKPLDSNIAYVNPRMEKAETVKPKDALNKVAKTIGVANGYSADLFDGYHSYQDFSAAADSAESIKYKPAGTWMVAGWVSDNGDTNYIGFESLGGGKWRATGSIQGSIDAALEPKNVEPGTRTNGTKEKAAAERLAKLLDKMDQVRIDRNTPEGSAKGIVRSVIEELRKERSVGDIPGLLDTAAQRLFRRYSAFSDVASEVAESLRAADKYAETVAKFKAKQESGIALSDIEVDRQSNGTGRIKTYKQRADEALSEIDERMGLGKQLLECLNS